MDFACTLEKMIKSCKHFNVNSHSIENHSLDHSLYSKYFFKNIKISIFLCSTLSDKAIKMSVALIHVFFWFSDLKLSSNGLELNSEYNNILEEKSKLLK